MPSRDLKNMDPSARRMWRKTDKFVQAEVKNKMEVARLQMCKKLYERQQSRAGFVIDKDKRQVSYAMRKMRDTTGYSLEAMPPDGPQDTAYERTSYFHDKSAFREKQQQRWRATEREVVRTVYAEADRVLKTPWDTDSFEHTTQAFNGMMRRLGYEVVDEDKLILQGTPVPDNESSTLPPERTQLVRQTSAPDIFQCLKSRDKAQMQHSNSKEESLEHFQEKKFSVSDWEKKTIENYAAAVTRPLSAPSGIGRRRKRVRSALGPRPCPLGAEDSLKYSEGGEGVDGKIQQRVRPHTVATPQRNVRSNADSLANSYPYKSVCDGNRTKTVNTSHHSKPNTNTAVTTVVNRPKGAKKVTDQSMKHNGLCLRRLSSIAECDSPVNTPSSKDKQEETARKQITKKSQYPKRHFSQTLIEKKSNAVEKGLPQSTNISASKLEAKATPNTQSSLMNTAKNKSTQGGCTSDSDKTSSPYANSHLDPTDSGDERVSLHGYDVRGSLLDHHESKSIHQEGRPIIDRLEHREIQQPVEKLKGGNYFTDKELPHWKRDLLVEAPPSVFSLRTPLKVGLVMSKAQRKRELEQMVDDNVRDIKGLVEQEQGRRIHARLSLYVTLNQMEQTLDMERDLALLAVSSKGKKQSMGPDDEAIV